MEINKDKNAWETDGSEKPALAASWAMASTNLHKATEVTQLSYIQETFTFNMERRDVVTKSENQVKFGLLGGLFVFWFLVCGGGGV